MVLASAPVTKRQKLSGIHGIIISIESTNNDYIIKISLFHCPRQEIGRCVLSVHFPNEKAFHFGSPAAQRRLLRGRTTHVESIATDVALQDGRQFLAVKISANAEAFLPLCFGNQNGDLPFAAEQKYCDSKPFNGT
jgi:hypothetical protein